MKKSRKKLFIYGSVALTLGLSCGLGFYLNSLARSTNDYNSSYVSVGEIWNGEDKTFNSENLNVLYKYLTGNKNATIDDVEALASGVASASTIRSTSLLAGVEGQVGYDTKDASQNVEVTLGGLTWQVCYLSEDKNGDAILTLWLSNSQQEAFEGREKDEGQYYGYHNGSLYSDWSANWTNGNFNVDFPSAMYGTSYIRAVTLNNGGSYAKNTTTISEAYQQDENSAFAVFTMDEFGLTEYLVTPRDMSWQEYQSARTYGASYSYPNDAWGDNIPDTGTSGGITYNFYNATSYGGYGNYSMPNGDNANSNANNWIDDYLWLPSMTETGWTSSVGGLWGLNVYQRMNVDGKTLQPNTGVGSTNGTAYNYSWLRSGHYSNANYA